MKIVHVCLAAVYVEGYGYQENILPQYHKLMGYDVTVISSCKSFGNKILLSKTDYVNEYGISVKFLEKSNRYYWYSRFNDYDSVYESISIEKPDIIFIHGGQFVALKDILRYCKDNPKVRLFIDQHGDFYNMNIKTLKNMLIQKCIYGYWMRKAVKYTEKFWGVTPWRCQYLKEVYGIPENKIGLLVMGGDDRYINFDKKDELRHDIRSNLHIDDDDFVLITGGKIDSTKNIHLLMQAVNELNTKKLKLIVFGQPNNEMEAMINDLSKSKLIRNIGWLDSSKVYDYFIASDLAVFPGTHSVLWEQACACGIPGVFKNWEGMHHVDVNGSARFLYKDSKEEIKEIICSIYNDKLQYREMKEKAWKYARKEFSYFSIAKKAIGIES